MDVANILYVLVSSINMDLLIRAIIAAIVVIAILSVVYYVLKGSLGQQVTKQQAESFITTDLLQTYPGSIVNVTSDTPSNYSGSWHIVVSVTENATSPCPSYFINVYDYPAFRLVSTPQNTYTSNCNIYVFSPNSAFKLGSSPVAIAWATKRVPSVIKYISVFGMPNVNASAHFQSNATSGGTWVLTYSSRLANYSVRALLADTNGTLLNSYNASK